ncbi:hypothetical protein ACMATS_14625 [Streptoverticillium reticulum]|uniref:hypothetical protein n=1 Tax=Streptoverticillium reticulum TaxID=1433415 RepID=UPI0039BEF2F7
MTARRPLLTAVAAGAVLCAVWCVPSAHATAERPGAAAVTTGAPPQGQAPAPGPEPEPVALADTGSVDTTPYLVGGIAFVGIGGALVTAAVRRGSSAP